MKGSIEKRGARSWRLHVFLGNDPGTGRRINVRRTVHGTKKDAQAQLNKLLADAQANLVTGAKSRTLRVYLEEWMRDIVAHRVRFNTLAQYQDTIDRYLVPTLGRVKLEELSPLHVQQIVTKQSEKGLSPRTIQLTHAVLRAALNDALRMNLVPRNVALSVRLPKMHRPAPSALSAAEVGRLLEALQGDHFEPFLRFLVLTGLRPSEAVALRWDDLDEAARTIRVRRTMRRFKGEWRVSEPKSERSHRLIELSAGAYAAVACQERDQPLVFTSIDGAPVDTRHVAVRHLKPALERAGLDRTFKLYNLRHTHATLLLEGGADVKTISEELGHSTVVLTLNTYVRGDQRKKRQAVDRLDALLNEAAPRPQAHAPN